MYDKGRYHASGPGVNHGSSHTTVSIAVRSFTPAEIQVGITRLNRRIEDLEQFNPNAVQRRWSPETRALQAAIDETLSDVFGHGTAEYNRYSDATRLDNGPLMIGSGDADHARHYLSDGKEKAIALLRQAVRGLQEKLTDGEAPTSASGEAVPPLVESRRIFIVHGHDEGARESVARFVQLIGFEPIILHEQPNRGRTIIEKVEAHADTRFAIVILTPDDEGRTKGGELQPRARQNVLLELGYFIGRLGRINVCALKRGEIEIPSDFVGVVYESLDGNWKQVLGRELEAAGFEIDWNKVMRS